MGSTSCLRWQGRGQELQASTMSYIWVCYGTPSTPPSRTQHLLLEHLLGYIPGTPPPPAQRPAVDASIKLSLKFHLNIFPAFSAWRSETTQANPSWPCVSAVCAGIAAGHARLLHPSRPWCDADAGLSSRVVPTPCFPPALHVLKDMTWLPPSSPHVRSGWGLFAKQCQGDYSSRFFAVHGSLGSPRRAMARPHLVRLVVPPCSGPCP